MPRPTDHFKDKTIEMVCMPDDPDPIAPGTKGKVLMVTDLGDQIQLVVQWENGRTLCPVIPPDVIRIVD